MYEIFSGERGLILKLVNGGDLFCLRIPAGLPEMDNQSRLAIEVKCPENLEPVERGEMIPWFWLEKVKRVVLVRGGVEELLTIRYWKDVRWFVIKGEGGVEVSSGGLPVECKNGEIYAYIVRPSGKENFALPKGLIEKGEKPEETAVREVFEETGLIVEPGPFIERVNYQYRHPDKKIRIYKEVFYFLLYVRGGDPSKHDWEVAEVKKVKLSEVDKYLKYSSEKKALRRLLERVKNGELNIC